MRTYGLTPVVTAFEGEVCGATNIPPFLRNDLSLRKRIRAKNRFQRPCGETEKRMAGRMRLWRNRTVPVPNSAYKLANKRTTALRDIPLSPICRRTVGWIVTFKLTDEILDVNEAAFCL